VSEQQDRSLGYLLVTTPSPSALLYRCHHQALSQASHRPQRLDDLAQVVRQTPQRPRATDRDQPAEQEPPQAPPLLDLPKDWLRRLLALGVGRPPDAVLSFARISTLTAASSAGLPSTTPGGPEPTLAPSSTRATPTGKGRWRCR
jgi:hypothetical protein